MNDDSLYSQLREAIASGRLHPNERLVEADLSAAYSVSRSAVRTALAGLTHDGLVEHERNRGAKVRLIGESEAVEIYEARAVLEALAARKAAARATEADVAALHDLIAEVGDLLAADRLSEASEINARLHERILAIADDATVARLVAGLNIHLVRFHYRTILQPDRPRQSLAEHTAVVDAIADRDEDAAEAAMRSHLQLVTATLSQPLPPLAE